MVQHTEEEKGTMLVLLKRLVDQRLPRLLDMKKRVDDGETLSDFDIQYLEEAFEGAHESRQYLEHFPEYEDMVGKLASLYEEITHKAVENQRAEK